MVGSCFHLRNCIIFIDCVYCQRLYPILRFLGKKKTKFLFIAAQKKFTEISSSLKALKSAVCLLLE